MIVRRLAAWGLAAAALIAAPVLANDSTAELRTGGLVLTKTAAIEMRSEDLSISAKAVHVRYVFRNTSAADVTTTVAFPMPDITTDGIDDLIAIPTEDPQNILGFTTTVDGKAVPMQVEQRAYKNGVDRTDFLRKLGIPLQPHLDATNAALDALPQATRDQLVKMDLAIVDEFDAGKGWEKHWRARWTLKTAFHWTQTFPAGKDLIVEHSYTPSVGTSAGTSMGSPYAAKDETYKPTIARYCVDSSFLAAVEAEKKKRKADYAPFTEQRISYVLVTGANWKKPIGDFHLTIDKGSSDYLVSFCGTGVKKTGPTTFEIRKSNFTPTRDLHILILQPYPAEGG